MHISTGDDALIFLLINFEKKIPSPFVFLGGEESGGGVDGNSLNELEPECGEF